MGVATEIEDMEMRLEDRNFKDSFVSFNCMFSDHTTCSLGPIDERYEYRAPVCITPTAG
jgi:hypothetical protein